VTTEYRRVSWRGILTAAALTTAISAASAQGGDESAFAVRSLQQSNLTFTEVEIMSANPALSNYAAEYRLPVDVARWSAGKLNGPSGKLFVQAFVPEKPRGTILFTHGYLDHSSTSPEFYRDLLAAGYAVVAWDLPGHGLSDGERGAVSDFSIYADALGFMASWCASNFPGPLYSVSHSTGCSANIELARRGVRPFAAMVFLAPLVHCDFWGWSLFGDFILGGVLKTVPRLDRIVTSNPEWEDFHRNHDPLQEPTASVSWVTSLIRWNERLASAPRLDVSVTVVQGTSDDVVDWSYNLPFLRSFMDVRREILIPGARHAVHCETEPFRILVLQATLDGLQHLEH
jgi:lysophospholipase